MNSNGISSVPHTSSQYKKPTTTSSTGSLASQTVPSTSRDKASTAGLSKQRDTLSGSLGETQESQANSHALKEKLDSNSAICDSNSKVSDKSVINSKQSVRESKVSKDAENQQTTAATNTDASCNTQVAESNKVEVSVADALKNTIDFTLSQKISGEFFFHRIYNFDNMDIVLAD